MTKQEKVMEVEGEVTEALPNAMFKVRLAGGRLVLGHLAGKMRIYHIKVMPGDRVRMVMSSYDETKGRIIFRDN
jgi:translation initiation factor IF-1